MPFRLLISPLVTLGLNPWMPTFGNPTVATPCPNRIPLDDLTGKAQYVPASIFSTAKSFGSSTQTTAPVFSPCAVNIVIFLHQR